MVRKSLRPRDRNDFRVAIICALPLEAGMVRSIFDKEESNSQDIDFGKAHGDKNTYTFGVIGKHNVVLVHTPGIGNVDSATIANSISTSFPSIEIAFIAGICGASPENPITKEEVVLGDCIISTALIQYDFGRQFPGRFKRKSEVEDALPRAGPMIRAFLAKLQTPQTLQELEKRLALHLNFLQQTRPEVSYPTPFKDRLFHASYLHTHHDIDGTCEKCVEGICTKSCNEIGCQEEQLINRARLTESHNSKAEFLPKLHFGRYGSATTTLKSGVDRDRLVKDDRIIAFEMEGAGIWENLPTVIVKSACDYADSHKSKEWQTYAAATAASGLKAILEQWVVSEVPMEVTGNFEVPFSLEGVPVPKQFINRSIEMQKLENALLPHGTSNRRKVFVLRGLGGIGKTQLAVEFMRLYNTSYSAIFWLDGNTEDSLKQSIARHASRIPSCCFSNQSRLFIDTGQGSIDTVVTEFLDWLKLKDNNRWLMIFDNVDREHAVTDPLSYNLKTYIPAVDHGSVLITTRLAQLERMGQSQEVKKVDDDTAKAILKSWFNPTHDETGMRSLLERLDGLPLAIAQAGSYLHKTGISMDTYLRLYDEQKEKVAETLHDSSTLLDDYPNRSVWTTWSISYNAILAKDKHVANLLVFWSFLDRNDFWFSLFERACHYDQIARHLAKTLGHIANEELSFIQAMTMLREYSLIEGSEGTNGYMMHAVVHRWIYFCYGIKHHLDLGLLALKVVGSAAPELSERDFPRLQQRLLPHVSMCSMRVIDIQQLALDDRRQSNDSRLKISRKDFKDCLAATNILGRFYRYQGKLAESEQMLLRVLTSCEEVFGHKSLEIFNIMNSLGLLYRHQGKLADAEQMLLRALAGREEALGTNDIHTLNIINNLALLYADQHRLDEAEQMFLRVLACTEKALGPKAISTITTFHNLGRLYSYQGKLAEAEQIFLKVLAQEEEALGPKHTYTLGTVSSLGSVYIKQGRPAEAEPMLLRALAGYEEALGSDPVETYIPALNTMSYLGDLYSTSRPAAARAMYERALAGYATVRGPSDAVCRNLTGYLNALEATENSNDDPGESKANEVIYGDVTMW